MNPADGDAAAGDSAGADEVGAGVLIGTTVTSPGSPSPATTSAVPSAVKLIASPCGAGGSGMRTGFPDSAVGTSDPDRGQTYASV